MCLVLFVHKQIINKSIMIILTTYLYFHHSLSNCAISNLAFKLHRVPMANEHKQLRTCIHPSCFSWRPRWIPVQPRRWLVNRTLSRLRTGTINFPQLSKLAARAIQACITEPSRPHHDRPIIRRTSMRHVELHESWIVSKWAAV